MSNKQCCVWHDHLPEVFRDDVRPQDCFDECGLAGMGHPSVCCTNCPQYDWFANKRGIIPYLTKEIMALPVGERP